MARFLNNPMAQMMKEGTRFNEDPVVKNIEACKELAAKTRSSLGPDGLNKMVINHLGKLFVTHDAATIMRELEVGLPAVPCIPLRGDDRDRGWMSENPPPPPRPPLKPTSNAHCVVSLWFCPTMADPKWKKRMFTRGQFLRAIFGVPLFGLQNPPPPHLLHSTTLHQVHAWGVVRNKQYPARLKQDGAGSGGLGVRGGSAESDAMRGSAPPPIPFFGGQVSTPQQVFHITAVGSPCAYFFCGTRFYAGGLYLSSNLPRSHLWLISHLRRVQQVANCPVIVAEPGLGACPTLDSLLVPSGEPRATDTRKLRLRHKSPPSSIVIFVLFFLSFIFTPNGVVSRFAETPPPPPAWGGDPNSGVGLWATTVLLPVLWRHGMPAGCGREAAGVGWVWGRC